MCIILYIFRIIDWFLDFYNCITYIQLVQPKKLKKLKKNFSKFLDPQGLTHSAQRRKFKNPSDNPKSIPPMTLHTKFQISTTIGLACRVGWVRKWHITSLIPSESVVRLYFVAVPGSCKKKKVNWICLPCFPPHCF